MRPENPRLLGAKNKSVRANTDVGMPTASPSSPRTIAKLNMAEPIVQCRGSSCRRCGAVVPTLVCPSRHHRLGLRGPVEVNSNSREADIRPAYRPKVCARRPREPVRRARRPCRLRSRCCLNEPHRHAHTQARPDIALAVPADRRCTSASLRRGGAHAGSGEPSAADGRRSGLHNRARTRASCGGGASQSHRWDVVVSGPAGGDARQL